jgi:hypothetical protein
MVIGFRLTPHVPPSGSGQGCPEANVAAGGLPGAGFWRWPDVQEQDLQMVLKKASCQVVRLLDDMISL